MAIIYVFIDPTIRVEHTVKVLAYFSADIILSVAHNSNNIATQSHANLVGKPTV